MTFDKAGKQFVLNTTDYPLLNGVSFRSISSAPSYPDSISNVVGLFNLASAKKPLGATKLLIAAPNGFNADMFFVADVPASPNDLALRIQATTTPGAESSWTDLNNGSAGRMAPRDVPNQFFLLLNDYPPAADLYFRVKTSAPGFVDNLSAARGPFTLIHDVPPVVTMIPPKGLPGSGDGRDLDHPILVSAGTINFGATAESNRQMKSFILRYDGSTVSSAGRGVASVRADYTTDEIGDHVIDAVAIDDLDGRARAGTEPHYIRVVPRARAGSAMTSAGSTAGETSAIAGLPRIFRVVRSGGKWNDPGTWVDSFGKPGVPGLLDFAVIGKSTVTGSGRFDVLGLSISGGRLAGSATSELPLIVGVDGIFTMAGGSFSYAAVEIGSGAKGELVNDVNLRFEKTGLINNLGTLNIHGSGGIFEAKNIENQGALNWLAPLTIHPLAGVSPVADTRTIASSLFSNSGLISGAAKLIGQDGSSLIGQDGTSFNRFDGGSLVAKGGGNIVATDGATIVAGGAGNIIAGGAGNIVAGGAGNIVAGGAGNLISTGGGFRAASSAENARAATAPTGFSQDGGETDLTNVTIRGDVTLEGGVLSGSGAIDGNLVNRNGYVTPGHSAGLIRVIGDFSQGAEGTLVLEQSGAAPSQFDQLQMLGTASLGGRLDVRLINGYKPKAADTFNPLGYKSVSGQFSSISSNAQVALKPDGMLTSLKPSVPNSAASKLLNISTRMRVEKGENALIGGFIVTGTEPKKVIIRALGPTLPVDGKLLDPTLELNGAGVRISNNNWKDDQAAAISATGIAPKDEREAAIVATLQPGQGYTAVVRGNGDTTGVGLVEVYDLNSGVASQLANISTRGLVQAGDNVMIGGLIIGGATPVKTLVRALGPSLTAQGIRGALQDPELELVDGNGNSLTNDDWLNTQESEIEATGVPPPNRRESAIVATLVPGLYTAIVRGKADTTGVALVEAYNLQ